MTEGTPIPRTKRRNFLFLAIGSIVVAFCMIMAIVSLPGSMTSLNVSASFSTSLYTDTYINTVVLHDENDSTIVTWNQGNDENVESVPFNTIIDAVWVTVLVNSSRLAPGGTVGEHLNLTVTITDTSSSVSTYYNDTPSHLPGDIGALQYWFFNFKDLTYALDQTGMYYIGVQYMIEVP